MATSNVIQPHPLASDILYIIADSVMLLSSRQNYIPAPYQILTWPCIVFNLIFCHFPLAHYFPAILASLVSKHDKLFCFRVFDWNVLSVTLSLAKSYSFFSSHLAWMLLPQRSFLWLLPLKLHPLDSLSNGFLLLITHQSLWLYTCLMSYSIIKYSMRKRTMFCSPVYV